MSVARKVGLAKNIQESRKICARRDILPFCGFIPALEHLERFKPLLFLEPVTLC